MKHTYQVRAILHRGIYQSDRDAYWSPDTYPYTTAGRVSARARCADINGGLAGSFGNVGCGHGADIYESIIDADGHEWLWRHDGSYDEAEVTYTPVDADGDPISPNDVPDIIWDAFNEPEGDSDANDMNDAHVAAVITALDAEWDGNNFVSGGTDDIPSCCGEYARGIDILHTQDCGTHLTPADGWTELCSRGDWGTDNWPQGLDVGWLDAAAIIELVGCGETALLDCYDSDGIRTILYEIVVVRDEDADTAHAKLEAYNDANE